MQKTKFPTIEKVSPKWYLLDASGQILGRLASKAASLLNGKKNPTYSPNQYDKTKVVIINSDKVKVTGDKLDQKKYYWHTGYPKGLRVQTLREALVKDSTKVIRKAVKGMLPKNRLLKKKMASLYVYKDENHKHKANLNGNKITI